MRWRSLPESADENAPPPRVVDPEVTRRKITVPKVHSRNVEVGVNYGMLSIEDFGTHPEYGVTAAYHVTEDWFFQAEAGRSNGRQHQLRNPQRHPTAYRL